MYCYTKSEEDSLSEITLLNILNETYCNPLETDRTPFDGIHKGEVLVNAEATDHFACKRSYFVYEGGRDKNWPNFADVIHGWVTF